MIKFRASSIGHIMTEAKGSGITERQLQELSDLQLKPQLTTKQEIKLLELIAKRDAPPELGDTVITHLVDKYVSIKYGRETNIESKYTNKGLQVEEDSLTLYSRYKKTYFTKNEENLSNDWITGTPDVIKERIIDIKSSWDIFTFFRTKSKPLNKHYYWQMQSYMALTGADTAVLAYCLTDTPDVILNDEKRRLLWKMGVISDQDATYLEACDKLDKLMTYSDIPLEERVHEVEIKRDDRAIESIYKRVEECREYMKLNFNL